MEDDANLTVWESEDFRVLRAYWRLEADLFWKSGARTSAFCDACNAEISPGDGYFRGRSRLGCENCCRRMLDAYAFEASRRNPNYFGNRELAKAKDWFSSHNHD